MTGYLPLPALRLLHAFVCLAVQRAFTGLADMSDDLAVRAVRLCLARCMPCALRASALLFGCYSPINRAGARGTDWG